MRTLFQTVPDKVITTIRCNVKEKSRCLISLIKLPISKHPELLNIIESNDIR